jgi:hypothetical protein
LVPHFLYVFHCVASPDNNCGGFRPSSQKITLSMA